MNSQKKYHKPILFLLLFVLLNIFSGKAQQVNEMEKDLKDDQIVRLLVEKMLERHGNFESWISTLSITFMNEIYDFKNISLRDSDDFGSANIYKYKVSLKPESSKGYANFILLKDDNRILYDGNEIVSIGIDKKKDQLDRSPVILLFHEYSLINLPWLTQLNGVNLEYAGKGELPFEMSEFEILRMTFGQEKGYGIHQGYYELYIHPKTGLLKGVKQTAIFPKLPGTQFTSGVPSLPIPLVHIFKGYVKKGELFIPDSFVTFNENKLIGVCFISHSTSVQHLKSITEYNH